LGGAVCLPHARLPGASATVSWDGDLRTGEREIKYNRMVEEKDLTALTASTKELLPAVQKKMISIMLRIGTKPWIPDWPPITVIRGMSKKSSPLATHVGVNDLGKKGQESETPPKISKIAVEIHESFAFLCVFTSEHVVVCVGVRRRRGAVHGAVHVGSCSGGGGATTQAAKWRDHDLQISTKVE